MKLIFYYKWDKKIFFFLQQSNNSNKKVRAKIINNLKDKKRTNKKIYFNEI